MDYVSEHVSLVVNLAYVINSLSESAACNRTIPHDEVAGSYLDRWE